MDITWKFIELIYWKLVNFYFNFFFSFAYDHFMEMELFL